MKKQLLLIVLLVAFMCCACSHKHEWQYATCEEPQKCTICEEVQGQPLGHNWQEATCEKPKQCTVCSKTEGEALDHNWKEATCNTPRTCENCHKSEGDKLWHNFEGTTCTIPGTCSRCGELQDSYGHSWKEATCINPKQCTVCNITEGTSLGHAVQNGRCTRCGANVLTSKDMDADYAYLLKNGEITKVELPRGTRWDGEQGFVLHNEITNAPIIKTDKLIVRTFNMSYVNVMKVEFLADRYYQSPTATFEKIGVSLYYFNRGQHRKVEKVNDLTEDMLVNQLPLESDKIWRDEYFLYGPSPETEYTVGYWYGPDYIETVLTTPYSKYLGRGLDEYTCKLEKTYDGYAVVDVSSLETGYYITYGFRRDGLIYIDNG